MPMDMLNIVLDTMLDGVSTMDNQTALAVQSLLESQSSAVAEGSNTTAVLEEDDVFQCGKCKKQFSALSAFMTHKREHCSSSAHATLRTLSQAPSTNSSSAFTSSLPANVSRQQTPTYTNVPASPLTQISQGIVLNDDLMTFSTIDQTIPISTSLQNTTVSNNPFLPLITPLTPRSTPCVSVFSTVNTSAFSFSQTVPTTVNSIVSGKHTPSILTKPTPTKQNTPKTTVNIISDIDPNIIKPKRKNTNNDPSTPRKVHKLKCNYCEKTFLKNFDLQQHTRSHTGEKPFQCIVCGRAFAQKSNVKKHMQTHKVWPAGVNNTLPKLAENAAADGNDESSPGQQSQDQNSSDSQTSSSLSQTTVQVNIGTSMDESGKVNIVIDNSYVCQYCNLPFKTYFLLKSHMTQHKSEQVYKCILKSCGHTFQELESFLEHTKTHETEMTYRCHMCNKHFLTLYELGVHQYSHSLYPNQGPKPGPRYFRCTKCMNKYATPEALDHHMSTTNHSYPCLHCEKTFPCERYLRRHLPTHGTMGLHVCQVCSKAFKTEHYLKMHCLIHSGEKPFKCYQCSAAFNRKDKLKRHELIHEPIKRFKCPFRNHTGCTKEFNRPDKLKTHIITHSGIKPFKCKECGKSFSRKPYLREHERSHKDDYKFRCPQCNKGFFREKLFQEHKCGQKERKRKIKAKVGRPKKKMITITDNSKQNENKIPKKRGRPRKQLLANDEIEVAPLVTKDGDDIQKDLGIVRWKVTESEQQITLNNLETLQAERISRTNCEDTTVHAELVTTTGVYDAASGHVLITTADNSVLAILPHSVPS